MADRISLTKTAIDALPVPGADRTYYYDAKVRGLALCVTSKATRSWYIYKRVNGRPERVLLGKYPDLSPDAARKQAAQVLAAIAAGVSPQQRKRLAREEATFGDLWQTYLEIHAKAHKKSWADDVSLWRRYLEPWAGRRLSAVTQAEVQRLHTRIGKDHPVGANRMLSLLSAAFNVCGRQYGCAVNPAEGVKRFRERSRERFLDGDELRRLFAALQADDPDWRDFFTVLLLCGARVGNVKAMRWEHVDLTHGVWRVPAQQSKNAAPMVIVLTDAVLSILRERSARVNGCEWVFPAKGQRAKPGQHTVEPKTAWARICRRADISGVRVHDLRRTHASWMAAGGASLPIIGKALGHTSPQATAVYARLDLDPVRRAVEAAGAAMLQAGRGLPGPAAGRDVAAESGV